MEHGFIDEHDVVSRYVAGHLSEDETRAFEAHFVDCPACVARLELEQDFRAGLLSADRRPPAATDVRGTRRPASVHVMTLAMAATIVIAAAAALGYVQVRRQLDDTRARVIELERRPAPAADRSRPADRISVVELDTTRGAGSSAPTVNVPPSATLVVFSLAVGDASDYSGFAAALQRGDGSTTLRLNDLQRASPTSVGIAIDASMLPPGDYTIVLEGEIRNRAPIAIARYPFVVSRR